MWRGIRATIVRPVKGLKALLLPSGNAGAQVRVHLGATNFLFAFSPLSSQYDLPLLKKKFKKTAFCKKICFQQTCETNRISYLKFKG